jgi:uncharacterized protein (DUF849 family)
MRVKACVNGPRLPLEHPRLAADPAVVAAEAREAVEAGAFAVHVHPKDAAGHDSLAPDDVARFVRAVRGAVDVRVGVTTGAWTGDAAARLTAIAGWRELPDFASVNAHEDGAEAVAEALLARGVGVEAGIWRREGLERWLRWARRGASERILVEIQDVADAAEVESLARALVEGVRGAEPDVPVLLHGEERSTWHAIRLAAAWGLPTRAGLEDSLTLPDGSVAPGNAALVRAALAHG